MASCEEMGVWLAAAETALHNVLIGGVTKVMRYGDKSVEYSTGNVGELRAYVARLTDQVNACNGTSSTLRRRAFGVIPQD